MKLSYLQVVLGEEFTVPQNSKILCVVTVDLEEERNLIGLFVSDSEDPIEITTYKVVLKHVDDALVEGSRFIGQRSDYALFAELIEPTP